METSELSALRAKVERGEKLTDDEFERLRCAAQSDSGPTLRLAWAHALVNAGQPGQAIGLFERLRRDFPREVQVPLGHARALIGMDRYSEAERALRDAQLLNPADPEALKGLAVCAMRRGELTRARQRVEEVLKMDPFDDEAQLLKAELDAVGPSLSPRASEQEFVDALCARLSARSLAHSVKDGNLVVQLGRGGVARLDLASLYAGYVKDGSALSDEVEAIARELAERLLGMPRGKGLLLSRVRPVLRPPAFIERAVGAVHREGPGGLWVFYVLEDPELVRYVPEGVMGSYHLTLDELDAAAWRELGRKPAEPKPVRLEEGYIELAPEPTGVWAIAVGDGHDGARLLCAPQVRQLVEKAGRPPYRVFLGVRELAIFCLESDLLAVAKLKKLAASPDGIEGTYRLEADGRLLVARD